MPAPSGSPPAAPAAQAGSVGAADPGRPAWPGLVSRPVLALVLATLVLEAYAWISLEGYHLADTVEYVALGEQLAREGALTAGHASLRPPAWPLALSLLFRANDALGHADERWIVLAARGLAGLFGIGLVFAGARLGALLAGARGGLVAGLLVAANPVFLRYAVDPLSDGPAGLLLGVGCVLLLERGDARRAAAGGLAAGLAAIVSYKVLPLLAAILLGVLLRDRWRHRRRWLAAVTGVAVAVALGVALDRLAYGAWGHSLANYVVRQVRLAGVPLLSALGMPGGARRLASWIAGYYGRTRAVSAAGLARDVGDDQSMLWYAGHLPEFLVLPVLLLAALALVRVLRRPRWSVWIAAAALLAYLVVLSAKHGKDYRLWTPALPLVGAFCALGWVELEQRLGGSRGGRLALGALLLAVPLLGVRQHRADGPRRHGAYWEAVAWLDRRVAAAPAGGRPVRFASAYSFATRYRHSPRLAWEALPGDFWMLGRLLESPAGSPTREAGARMELALSDLDWFLVTRKMLLAEPAAMAVVARKFSVEAAFFEPGHATKLGAVLVLRRLADDPPAGARLFLERAAGVAPEAWRARRGLSPEVRFEGAGPDGAPRGLTLLGTTWEELPGSGFGWMTWHWTAPLGIDAPAFLRVRVEDARGAPLFARDAPLLHGVLPPGEWGTGTILVCGRLVPLRRAELLRAGGPAVVRCGVRLVDAYGLERGRLAPVGAAAGNERDGTWAVATVPPDE